MILKLNNKSNLTIKINHNITWRFNLQVKYQKNRQQKTTPSGVVFCNLSQLTKAKNESQDGYF